MQASEHAGWQRGGIRADENLSLECAVQYLDLLGHEGVCTVCCLNMLQVRTTGMSWLSLATCFLPSADIRPYRFKEITLKKGGCTRWIEIDGMAVSKSAVVLVERKPIINMQHVEELIEKLSYYE